MKVLNMIEGLRPAMAPYIQKAASNLGRNAEIVQGVWDVDFDDIHQAMKVVEDNGPNSIPAPREFAENNDAEIVVGSFCPFSAEGMDALKNVKIIGVIRAGLENIDVKAATERGILVINATGRNAHAVSDFTIGLLLAECRNIARAYHELKLGNWNVTFSNAAHIPDLYRKSIGLVGFGYIGRLMAKKLSGFDVRILVYDPYIKPKDVADLGIELVDKETLFKEADFVSIHARYTPETHHIVGRNEIAFMKPTSYIINTARAGLLDTEALVEALKEKRIAGAALDVFDEEPLSLDSSLLNLDNVTLTSHRAGSSRDATMRSPELLFERIGGFIDGTSMEGIVNKEVLEMPELQNWLKDAKEKLGR